MFRAAAWLALALLGAAACGAAAQPVAPPVAAPASLVPLRSGAHPGYFRIVLDLPAGAEPRVAQDARRVSVALPAGLQADAEALRRRLPPGLAAAEAAPGSLTLDLAAGAGLRSFRIGNRLVLDVLDAAPGPTGPTAAPTAATAAAPFTPPARVPLAAPAASPPLALPVPPVPPPPPEVVARATSPVSQANATQPPAPPSEPAQPAAAPVDRPAATAAPIAAVPAAPPAPARPPNNLTVEEATPRPPPSGPVTLAVRPAGENAITLPFDARTGIAAFRRGGSAWIVVDEPRPLDVAPLRGHPRFGALEVSVAPAATVLRLPLDPALVLRPRRDGASWLVEAVPAAAPAQPLRAEVAGAEGPRLALPAGRVGRSAALRDPATGETLLVGTVRDPSYGVAPARAYAAFSLPPTASGILVVPQSDSVALRALTDGFVIAAGQAGAVGLPLAAGDEGALAAAAGLTRRFDLSAPSDRPQADRIRRLTAETGAAPPLARLRLRMETAEAMLALGLAAEAHGVLALAAADDPAAAREPRLAGLTGVAALLAGRLEESAGLMDPRLDGSDEIALWRALRATALGESATAQAPVFAATAPLAATYAAPLRARIAPLLAEGMAAGGEAAAAQRLLDAAALPEEATHLARGRIAEARGDIDAALAAYDAAARGRDRLQRARALAAGTELALASGRIDAAAAAKRLDDALFAWRGDGFEIAQRLRIAELRLAAGDGRGAIGMLRETGAMFPDQEAALRPRLVSTFGALFREGADAPPLAHALPPAQAVTLFEDNIDLLPPGAEGEAMIARLAERLLQLDLPGRAAALVARVMEAQQDPPARAQLGARLAAMRLADRDPMGARAALAASVADGLPRTLVRERRILEARALADSGETAAALAALGELADPAALDLRAGIAAGRGDWAAAVPALAALAAATLPPPGAALDEAQRRNLVRLTAAAALAGQTDLLGQLARERGEAMRDGPLSEPFRLLTADPLRGAADLPRIAAELQLARALPQALAAIAPPGGPSAPR